MVSLRGVVHGKIIQLDEEPGLPDGQQVTVAVEPAPPLDAWGEGIKRSAGAAAELPGFDEAFAQVERERRTAAFRDSPR
mgnify:CR=1 FL=1